MYVPSHQILVILTPSLYILLVGEIWLKHLLFFFFLFFLENHNTGGFYFLYTVMNLYPDKFLW